MEKLAFSPAALVVLLAIAAAALVALGVIAYIALTDHHPADPLVLCT